jgi:hypothetical protein
LRREGEPKHGADGVEMSTRMWTIVARSPAAGESCASIVSAGRAALDLVAWSRGQRPMRANVRGRRHEVADH